MKNYFKLNLFKPKLEKKTRIYVGVFHNYSGDYHQLVKHLKPLRLRYSVSPTRLFMFIINIFAVTNGNIQVRKRPEPRGVSQ